MSTARYLVGNALDLTEDLPDGSVNAIITSPPYLNLRKYLSLDDSSTNHEIGQEDSPGDFLESLLTVMDALWRPMADDATFWFVLGDTHAGSGGAGGDYAEGGMREGQPTFAGSGKKMRSFHGKYGDPNVSAPPAPRKLKGLNGQSRRDRELDEALGIIPQRAHHKRDLSGWPRDQSVCWIPELFGASLAYGKNLLTGTEHRQWVTRPPVTWCKLNPPVGRLTRTFRTGTELIVWGGKHQTHYFDLDAVRVKHPDKSLRSERAVLIPEEIEANEEQDAPPLNWWVCNPASYKGAHYAVFPGKLIFRPIIAGCPKGGTVLDPFAGTGTTLGIATANNRNAIGFDLDKRNVDLARERVGLFLEVIDDPRQKTIPEPVQGIGRPVQTHGANDERLAESAKPESVLLVASDPSAVHHWADTNGTELVATCGLKGKRVGMDGEGLKMTKWPTDVTCSECENVGRQPACAPTSTRGTAGVPPSLWP